MRGVVATILKGHMRNLERAEELGADVVEIRLDREYVAPERIKSMLPLIFTIRRNSDGGFYTGDEKTRLEILEMCSEYGAVDIEADCFSRFRGEGDVIISYHDLKKTPEYSELRRLAVDYSEYGIVKIAVRAREKRDAVSVLKLVSEYSNVVAFCLGERFAFTRVGAYRMGAPLLYSYVGDERGGEGQPHLQDVKRILEVI